MANILILGASRGLGSAFSMGLPDKGDTVWLISRSRPESLDRADGINRNWIQADLAAPQQGASTVAEALSEQPIDVLIYNAGIWEDGAFGGGYQFEIVGEQTTLDIINVNLTSVILCVQKLLPNLRRADNAKVILIGSTSGLENTRCPEVAYTASKFGLRGVAHSLRQSLRDEGVAVTCINPGTIAGTPYDDGAAAISAYGDTKMPVHDLISVVKCVMSLSRASCIKEIDMPALADLEA